MQRGPTVLFYQLRVEQKDVEFQDNQPLESGPNSRHEPLCHQPIIICRGLGARAVEPELKFQAPAPTSKSLRLQLQNNVVQ